MGGAELIEAIATRPVEISLAGCTRESCLVPSNFRTLMRDSNVPLRESRVVSPRDRLEA